MILKANNYSVHRATSSSVVSIIVWKSWGWRFKPTSHQEKHQQKNKTVDKSCCGDPWRRWAAKKKQQLESIHNWRPSESLRNAYMHNFHACVINCDNLMMRNYSHFGQYLKMTCTISCILRMSLSCYCIQVHLSICQTDWVIAIFVLANSDTHLELG